MVSTALALRSASSLDRFKAWRTDMLLRLFFVSFLKLRHTHNTVNPIMCGARGAEEKKMDFQIFGDIFNLDLPPLENIVIL